MRPTLSRLFYLLSATYLARHAGKHPQRMSRVPMCSWHLLLLRAFVLTFDGCACLRADAASCPTLDATGDNPAVCANHGTCDTDSGTCYCDPGWTFSDCSVGAPLPALPPPRNAI
jgi:hypothetical protein